MRASDYIIDVGPGAGKYGGEIIAEGTIDEILKNKNSITGQYLSNKKIISPFACFSKVIYPFLASKAASPNLLCLLTKNLILDEKNYEKKITALEETEIK